MIFFNSNFTNPAKYIKPIPYTDTSDPVDYLMELSKKNRDGRPKLPPQKGVHVGLVVDKEIRGYKLKNYIPRDFWIEDTIRPRHMCCFGTTGTGKTKLMTYLIYQDILMGNNVAILNPKSDPFGEGRPGNELLSYIVQACVQAGRLDEIIAIMPVFPECSIELNPLQRYIMPDELIEHVISSVKAKEKYYEDVASEVSTAIITSMIAQAEANRRDQVINLLDIKEKVDYKSLQDLGTTMDYNYRNFPDPSVREKIEEALLTIRQIGQSPQDFFAKVSSSLRTVLTTMTSSTTGKLIGRARSNEFVKRIENNEGVIFLCNTDNLLATRASHIINRIIVSMIKTMAGRAGSGGTTFSRPLSVYIDEGHNVLFKGIEELFNKGRSARVYIHFFTQSLSQMIEAIGEPATRSIEDNINTWFFMRINSPETIEYIAKTSPEIEKWTPFVSVGNGDMGTTLRPDKVSVFRQENLSRLRQTFYYLKCGTIVNGKEQIKYYKGQVPTIPPPSVRVVPPISKEITGD